MIGSILVPLDGSRLAEAAIPTARRLAKSARGGLRLLHVRPGDEDPAAARAYLGEAAKAIAHGDGPAADFEIREGSVVDALRNAAGSDMTTLVVMATRGEGDPGPAGRRSIAERLASCTKAPILLVKPCGGSTVPCEPVGCERILAALDLGSDLEPAVSGLADFAVLSQAHVTLFTVVPPEFELPRTAERRHDALTRLDRIADRLRAQGVRVGARVAAGSDVAATVVAEAKKCGADVVVLRPRSRVPPQGLFGRTTDAVIRRSETPILVLVLPPLERVGDASDLSNSVGEPPSAEP